MQTVCSAVHNLQCVIPMLQIDSVCTVLLLLLLFVLLTYTGSATSRKVAGSIPDGVTVIFQILQIVGSWFLGLQQSGQLPRDYTNLLQNCQKLRCPMSLNAYLRT